jgi:SAF domain
MATRTASSLDQASQDPDGQGPRSLRVTPTRRRRRPALILVGALLTIAGAAIAAQLFLEVGGRTAVLAVARPIPAGHTIADQDLTEVRISVDPALQAVPAADRDQVVGKVATVSLLAQSLLPREAITAAAVPAADQAIVGIALKPGQMPDELKAGDHVMLVLTPPTGGAAAESIQRTSGVLVPQAQVFGLRPTDTGDATVVSVVVSRDDAATVARAQATGQVSLVLVAAAP